MVSAEMNILRGRSDQLDNSRKGGVCGIMQRLLFYCYYILGSVGSQVCVSGMICSMAGRSYGPGTGDS